MPGLRKTIDLMLEEDVNPLNKPLGQQIEGVIHAQGPDQIVVKVAQDHGGIPLITRFLSTYGYDPIEYEVAFGMGQTAFSIAKFKRRDFDQVDQVDQAPQPAATAVPVAPARRANRDVIV